MSSSSGGDPRSSGTKGTTSKKQGPTTSTDKSEWTTVSNNKRKLKNISSPISPNTQITTNKRQSLDNANFDYDNISLSPGNMVGNPLTTVIKNINTNDIDKTTAINDNISSSQTHIDSSTLLNFPIDYNGPNIILVESTSTNKNAGNWHPLKAAKFFSTNFTGITNIKSVSSKKIKLTLASIMDANAILNSNVLSANEFSATIPSTLLFSYGVIKLDSSITENDFWEGVSSSIPIDKFKRIVIKKDGSFVSTRIVELKFTASKIPDHITIFNMIFEVNPSVRSPIQCNNCLRFGHTTKFCRSVQRCSHCGETKHSIDSCLKASDTDPSCIFCKLPHLATDRSCQEWIRQREIKRIMATENLSYYDALNLKNKNYCSSAFKFSEIVSKPPASDNPPTVFLSQNVDFPKLDTDHNTHLPVAYNKKKTINRPSSPTKKHFTLPHPQTFSSSNGSYFNYKPNNNNPPGQFVPPSNDFSWIHTLSKNLSESLTNSPSFHSSFSSSGLQALIESSLFSLLSIPNLTLSSQ